VAGSLGRRTERGGVVISGRAGVGKSRLAREAAAECAAKGWAIRWIACTATAHAIPLGAFARWADGLDDNPLKLVGRVVAALVPENTPVVVVVDDAHLLDDLSAFVLQQLVFRAGAPVIVTIREGEPLPDAVASVMADDRLDLLDLQPLTDSNTESLVAAVLGGRPSSDCVSRLWHYTQGNPLFLRHLVGQERDSGRLAEHAGVWTWTSNATVSSTLLQLVKQHMGAISEPVRDVLDLVAVSEPLECEYLARLASPTAISDAEQQRLIVISATADGDRVTLGHPLYGEVRRSQAGALRLRRLRGAIVREMMTPSSSSAADAVRLGMLLLDSNLDPDADVLMTAAAAAFGRLDLNLAVRLSIAATQAGAGPDAEILLAHSFGVLNRGQECEELLCALSRRDLTEAQMSMVIGVRAGNLLWPLARPDDSWMVIDDGLARATPTQRPALLAFRALQLAKAGRPSDCLAVMSGVDLSVLSGYDAIVAVWALVLAHGDLGHHTEASRCADKGHEIIATSAQVTYQVSALAEFHVRALVLAGYVADAVVAAERAVDLCNNVPGRPHSMAQAIHGMALLGRCALPAAMDQLAPAIHAFDDEEDTSGVRYCLTIFFVQLLARIGHVDESVRVLAHLRAIRHPTFVYAEPDYLLSVAWVAAARGRMTEARNGAARGAELARRHGQLAREVMCLQVQLQFGDARVGRRLDELAHVVEGPRVVAAAHYARALAAGDGADLSRVSMEFEAFGDLLAAADASAHAATAYRRHNRRGAALTALGRAQEITRHCGAAPSPALREAETPLPFTPREREIVSLLAEGLANRDIARVLNMSPRTVEGHIYRASRRAGVDNRADLAAMMEPFS
jgi:DNA-binding CsgD family transcriptional regulator/type II secretory pathway predicted ATPase ExeA